MAHPDTAPAASGAEAWTLEALPNELLLDLRQNLSLSDEQITDVLGAVRDGARNMGDYLGLSPAAANTLESMALAYYRHKQYGPAAHLFAYLIELTPQRGSAWRGLGACHQATKRYAEAVFSYLQGLEQDPKDLPMQVFLGECYALMGARDMGRVMLRRAVAQGATRPWHKTYIQRAEAILRAQASEEAWDAPPGEATETPPPMTEPTVQAAGSEAIARDMERLQSEDVSQYEAMLDRPELRDTLAQLQAAVDHDIITRKQLAGFTDEQLHGGYVAACRYLEMNQPVTAMQICGWLIYLDSRNADYLQLAGIISQHLSLHCLADYLHGLSLIYEPDNPTTLIYRGEAKIFSEERHAGCDLIRRGLTLCEGKADLHELSKRGRALLQRFDTATRRANAAPQPAK